MPTQVPLTPQPNPQLERLFVGTPISAGSAGQRWNNDLLLLLAYCQPPIAQNTIEVVSPSKTLNTYDLKFSYTRSPGCQAVLFEVELWDTTGDDPSCTITITATSMTWLDANGLDGSDLRASTSSTLRPGTPIRGIANVTGLTVGTATSINVTWDDDLNSLGIRSVRIHELPMGAVNPVAAPTTEVGLDGDWPYAGNPLWDGATNAASGFTRLVDQLDKARSQVRRHWQISAPLVTNYCWLTTANVSGALNWSVGGTATQDPYWTIRPRRLYTVNDANNYTIRVWYRTSVATAGHDGELKVRADNGTSNVTATLTLAATTTWTLATSTIAIPTDEEECSIRIRGHIVTATETLYIAHVALIEAET